MIFAYKKVGETPLQLLNKLRNEKTELENETLSYAGRLDPMAEGEMLILVGKKENQDRKKYLNFDKTYEAQILFGFETDSLDILGMVNKVASFPLSLNSTDLKNVIEQIAKITEIEYPAYSSKVVNGKPLFEWQNLGKIKSIKIPKREVKIKKAELVETLEINGLDLWNYLEKTISSVEGDFRQKQILTKWHNIFYGLNIDFSKLNFKIAKIKFKVSSGTYIRVLSGLIGDELGIPTTLLHLKRTKIHTKFSFLRYKI